MSGPARAVSTVLVSIALVIGGLAAVPAPAHAGVEDFSYDHWHGEYLIDVDDSGRAIAEVTETLVARFPDFDQNRGIIRGLPLRYEGARSAPTRITVTDEHGEHIPFEVEDEGDFRAILTGDNRYVHGAQTYVISYTLPDIVLAATTTEVDEFYWDLVPIERRQMIDEFSADITFSPALSEHLTGDAACYSGPAGSTADCDFDLTAESDEASGTTTFSIPEQEMPPRSGITAAIALDPGTVVQPPARTPSFVITFLPGILSGAALLLGGIGLVFVQLLRVRRRTFRGTVVAQYDVPPHLPPLIAAPIVGTTASPVSAEILHLAVLGSLRLEDSEAPGGIFAKSAAPTLRLLDPQPAGDPLDALAVSTIFPTIAPGVAFTLPKRSEAFAKKMQGLVRSGKKEAQTRGYFTRESSTPARVLGFIGLGLLALSALLLIWGGIQGRDMAMPVGLTLFPAIPGVLLLIAGLIPHRVHTPAGAEAREYLEGVRLFIRVAEADRMRFLQSYSGAERRVDGSVDVLHLYERLLPYAMLFGMVKEWSRVLQVAYSTEGVSAPYWYPAVGIHGLNRLDSQLSSLVGSIQSSASYTSSSSGGSSGGGFSGGGGGGGFSGGR